MAPRTIKRQDTLKNAFLKKNGGGGTIAQEVNVSQMISPVATIKVIGCG